MNVSSNNPEIKVGGKIHSVTAFHAARCLPAGGKQLSKCCACSEGGRRKRTEQKPGLAEARVLAATHRTTGEKRGKKATSFM